MRSFWKKRLWIWLSILVPVLYLFSDSLNYSLPTDYIVGVYIGRLIGLLVWIGIFEGLYRLAHRPGKEQKVEVKTIKFTEPSTGKTLEGEIVNSTIHQGVVWLDVRSHNYKWAVPMKPVRDPIYRDNNPTEYEDIFPSKL